KNTRFRRQQLQNFYFNLDRLPFTFAALREPRSQTLRKTPGRQAETRFQFSFANGQRIVKIGGVREISHRELVQPLQRARSPLASNQHIHLKLLRVHKDKDSISHFRGGRSRFRRLRSWASAADAIDDVDCKPLGGSWTINSSYLPLANHHTCF